MSQRNGAESTTSDRSAKRKRGSRTPPKKKQSNKGIAAEGRKDPEYKRRRAIRIAEVRDKIDTNTILKNIAEIDSELALIGNTLKDGILVDKDGNIVTEMGGIPKNERVYLVPRCDEYEERLYRLRINALDKRASLQYKMLNKVLPDLKAEDSDDGKGKDGATTLADSLKELGELV